jgi:hypothetical protein
VSRKRRSSQYFPLQLSPARGEGRPSAPLPIRLFKQRHNSATSRHMRPSFSCTSCPLGKSEGAGNAGRPPRPQPRVQNKKAHEHSHHGHAGSPGTPCAMVLTVSFVLSPVTGLVCHRRQRSCLRQLDTSVGASEPHDFAVRSSIVRQRAASSTASHPAFVTIAKRPSEGRDGRAYIIDLGQTRSGNLRRPDLCHENDRLSTCHLTIGE